VPKKQILVQLSIPNRIGLAHFDFDEVLKQVYPKSPLGFVQIFISQFNQFYPFLFLSEPSFCVNLLEEYFSRKASLPSIVDIPFEYDHNPDTNDLDEQIHKHRYKDFYFVSHKTLILILLFFN
jgi:hypothetical protein